MFIEKLDKESEVNGLNSRKTGFGSRGDIRYRGGYPLMNILHIFGKGGEDSRTFGKE